MKNLNDFVLLMIALFTSLLSMAYWLNYMN